MLFGLIWPGAYTVPPTKQAATQVDPLQMCPEPQLAPVAAVVHAELLVPGSQLWQGLAGLALPDG
jgi:hypothetical protein